jgi:hypothetical protein
MNANAHEMALTMHTFDQIGYGIGAAAYPKNFELKHCFKRVAASFCAEEISDYSNQSQVFQSVRAYLAPTKHRPASLARFVINCVKAVREHGARWSRTERDRFVGHFLATGCKRSRRKNSMATKGGTMGGERQQLGAVFSAIFKRSELRAALKQLDDNDGRAKLKATLMKLFQSIKAYPAIEDTIADIRLSFQPELEHLRSAAGKSSERDAVEKRLRRFRQAKKLSLPVPSTNGKGENSFDALDRRVRRKLRNRLGHG